MEAFATAYGVRDELVCTNIRYLGPGDDSPSYRVTLECDGAQVTFITCHIDYWTLGKKYAFSITDSAEAEEIPSGLRVPA